MAINQHVISCTSSPTLAPPSEGMHWINTVSKQVWLSVGTDTVADWILVNESDINISGTITAGNSFEFDVTPLASFCAIKYIVCMSGVAQNKWRSFEMLGSRVDLTNISDTISSLLGAVMDVDFDLVISGTDVKLIGTNNEAFDVDVKIHKNLL